MPAIQIDRLNQQIQSVFAFAAYPMQFLAKMKEFLEVHTNLAYQTGTTTQRNDDLFSYHLAPIVIKQMQLALVQFGQKDPAQGLIIADLLWKQEIKELRYFAILILGNLPKEYLPKVIKRLSEWGDQQSSRELKQYLFTIGTEMIRKDHVKELTGLITDWADSSDSTKKKNALIALHGLATDQQFEDIPFIFTRSSPFLNNMQDLYKPLLHNIFATLTLRTPIETAFFLRHTLISNPNKQLSRFIKQLLPGFPGEQQKMLKQSLQNQKM